MHLNQVEAIKVFRNPLIRVVKPLRNRYETVAKPFTKGFETVVSSPFTLGEVTYA